MAVHPVQDLKGSLYINRTLALALTEAQLGHAFIAIRHKLDGVKYHEGLGQAVLNADFKALRDQLGKLANLYRFPKKDPPHKAPEHWPKL
jgi:hypothetical protein